MTPMLGVHKKHLCLAEMLGIDKYERHGPNKSAKMPEHTPAPLSAAIKRLPTRLVSAQLN